MDIRHGYPDPGAINILRKLQALQGWTVKNQLDYPWFLSKFVLNPVDCIENWAVNCFPEFPYDFYKQQRKTGLGKELKPEGSALPPWSQDVYSSLPQTENKAISGSASSWKLPEQTSISIPTQLNSPFTAGELSDAMYLLAWAWWKLSFFSAKPDITRGRMVAGPAPLYKH